MPQGTVQVFRLRGDFNNVLAHALGGCPWEWDALGGALGWGIQRYSALFRVNQR